MRPLYLIVGLVVLFLASSLFVASTFYNFSGPKTVAPFSVEVQKGGSLRQVAKQLKQAEVISSVNKFVLLAKLMGKEQNLRWGEYEFNQQGAHPIDVLRQITEGELKKYKVTVPEGYNSQQIAELLQYHELVDAIAFEDYVLSEEAAEKHSVPGPTLEGYLFPTTYFLRKGMTAVELADEMVLNYKKTITDEMRQRMEKLRMSEREVVTLASIIEKETSEKDERGQISAVFHNRLQKNMRLQADPTVIYGINQFDGNITKKHLQTYTPYNTYRIKGLPPGPIASPGKAAIEAALFPEQSDFLYFVANDKGAHDFSRTYKEHHEKVLRYQVKSR